MTIPQPDPRVIGKAVATYAANNGVSSVTETAIAEVAKGRGGILEKALTYAIVAVSAIAAYELNAYLEKELS